MRPRHPLTIGLAIVVLPPIARYLMFMGFIPRLLFATLVVLLVEFATIAKDKTDDSSPSIQFVDCPACHSREIAERDRCRVCDEPL